jgi:ATP adenylyltransferase
MLNFLYAPWRKKYTDSLDPRHKKSSHCIFCTHFAHDNDADNFILKRFTYCIVMLNLYPYNEGHLLIVPKKHASHLYDIDAEARAELIELASALAELLKTIKHAHGINIGMNLEKAAGAGIPEHLHMHVLPRYNGDTNFLPIIGNAKQISYDLIALYHELKPHVQALKI